MTPQLDYSGGIAKGRQKLIRVLGEAKSNLYKTHVIAKEETLEEMADRVWAVFNEAERLFLDERQHHWGIRDATEAEMAREYGPKYK